MNKKIQAILILSLYMAFIYFLYLRLGINDTNEAEKYIGAAKQIAEGNILDTFKNYTFYFSYVLFLSLFLPMGGIKFVIIIQLVLNIIASLFLKKALKELTGSNKFGVLAQILFLFCYPIQVWTLTLFSDNFFVCLISISLFYTIKKNKTKADLIIWIFLCIALLSARPPGIMFVYTNFAYYLYQIRLLKPCVFFSLMTIILIMIFALLFNTKVETKAYIKPIVAGCVIIDKPDYDVPAFNQLEKASLSDAYKYLFRNKGALFVSDLYLQKFKSFFILTRPYYSNGHNLILKLFYLLYPFTLAGIYLLFKSNKKSEVILFLFAIFLSANLTGLTYNEWHYRFTIEIFPILFLLSAYFLALVFKKRITHA